MKVIILNIDHSRYCLSYSYFLYLSSRKSDNEQRINEKRISMINHTKSSGIYPQIISMIIRKTQNN